MSKVLSGRLTFAFFIILSTLCSANDIVLAGSPALRPRVTLPKPERTEIGPKRRADWIIVKFREGTRVREHSGRLVAALALNAAEEERRARHQLTKEKVERQLALVNALLDAAPRRRWERLFKRVEEELEEEKRLGESHSGEELADLNLYFSIHFDNADAQGAAALIDRLNGLDIIELAYPGVEPSPADCRDLPPATPSYLPQQGYLDPPPGGIHARFAWQYPGGRGEGIRIIDVEGGWNLTHENLPDVFFQAGENNRKALWWHHGTAVFGMLAGCVHEPEEGRQYGVTGIANQAAIGYSSIFPWPGSYAPAINKAAAQLNAGEIILLELQGGGMACDFDCNCRGVDDSNVPAEHDQADFDAVRSATARDIIVVQAAANGGNNLDCPAYQGRFDRSVRDSGAIFVGAGSPNGRMPLDFSNYGTRVDLQGWGLSVMTTGYGGIRAGGDDQNQWYTATFGGTSSAAPIVTGAVASIQGILLAAKVPPFRPQEMLYFLQATGTPQAESPRWIGPLPNLQASVMSLFP